MINDSVLIRIVRFRGHRTTWPEAVRLLKERLKEVKLGFPGLGNDHLSLVPFKNIKEGDLFIWDPYLEYPTREGDEAPLLLNWLRGRDVRIDGIGCGIDSVRDPDRIKLRWMDMIEMPPIDPEALVLRVDVRPTLNGGPGYYYFFRSPRDFRY